MGAVSKIQIKYGCNFTTAIKVKGISDFLMEHREKLLKILNIREWHTMDVLITESDNVLDMEERKELCWYISEHEEPLLEALKQNDADGIQEYVIGFLNSQKGQED